MADIVKACRDCRKQKSYLRGQLKRLPCLRCERLLEDLHFSAAGTDQPAETVEVGAGMRQTG